MAIGKEAVKDVDHAETWQRVTSRTTLCSAIGTRPSFRICVLLTKGIISCSPPPTNSLRVQMHAEEECVREWYELKFSLEFRSKFGAEFQDFFSSIMERGYPSDFQKVKPYGKHGDRKCDGYHQSLQRVYQVYAPEKMNVTETNTKITNDRAGAIEHWKEKMSTWVFVHNQWRGIPPDVLKKLIDLDQKEGIGVLRWCEPELREEFFKLPINVQVLLLGPAPTPQTVGRIQMKDVLDVANVIAQQAPPPPEEVKEVPAGKLKANALSQNVQELLKLGARKSKLVKNFFSQWHDPELGDRIARAFRAQYEQLRDDGVIADDAFFALWKFAGGGTQKSVSHEAAVLALLAFLFEECDIFEPATLETTK